MHAPLFLVGSGALGALPVALIDFASTLYVLRVWRLTRGGPGLPGALPLALFFLALGFLALAQTVMMSVLDVRTSFLCNYLAQSVSVVLTAPPLLTFAYRFLGVMQPREARVAVPLVTVASLLVAAGFVVDALTTPDARLFYNFEAEHTQHEGGPFDPLAHAIPTLLFVTYSLALSVLLRKWRVLRGPARRSALAFCFIVVAGIVGVAVNRLETQALGLPIGTYTTYMLWVTLLALLLFVTHTDEITRFHDRVAALVLVCVLGSLAVVAERAVDHVEQREAKDRAAAAADVAGGDHARGVLYVTSDPKARPGPQGKTPYDGVILTPAPGGTPLVAFSYLEARRAADDVALPASAAMVLATIFVLVVVPRAAELSVLRPLRRLERAGAESRSKSVFLAAMSHELKTPLNAVLHHARILGDTGVPLDRGAVAERADVVAMSAEHLLALIEALLAAGKHDAATTSPFPPVAPAREATDVATLLRDVVAVHKNTIDRRGMTIAVDLGPDDGALRLMLDRRLLWQVLTNLVGNAAKYGERTITVSARARPGGVRVAVADGGAGVPEELRARVFEPFFQQSPRDGAGLGLAIARQLTEAMGGTLTLEGGATFVVDVVAAPAPPLPPLSSSSSSPASSSSSSMRSLSPSASASASSSSAAPSSPAPLPSRNGVGDGVPAITPALREELLGLARVGDIVMLRTRAGELARADETAAFASSLERLASRFQVRAIRQLLGDDA